MVRTQRSRLISADRRGYEIFWAITQDVYGGNRSAMPRPTIFFFTRGKDKISIQNLESFMMGYKKTLQNGHTVQKNTRKYIFHHEPPDLDKREAIFKHSRPG